MAYLVMAVHIVCLWGCFYLIGISVRPLDTIFSFIISVSIYLIHDIFSLLQNCIVYLGQSILSFLEYSLYTQLYYYCNYAYGSANFPLRDKW